MKDRKMKSERKKVKNITKIAKKNVKKKKWKEIGVKKEKGKEEMNER